jgi:uncharacterized membrane protein
VFKHVWEFVSITLKYINFHYEKQRSYNLRLAKEAIRPFMLQKKEFMKLFYGFLLRILLSTIEYQIDLVENLDVKGMVPFWHSRLSKGNYWEIWFLGGLINVVFAVYIRFLTCKMTWAWFVLMFDQTLLDKNLIMYKILRISLLSGLKI